MLIKTHSNEWHQRDVSCKIGLCVAFSACAFMSSRKYVEMMSDRLPIKVLLVGVSDSGQTPTFNIFNTQNQIRYREKQLAPTFTFGIGFLVFTLTLSFRLGHITLCTVNANDTILTSNTGFVFIRANSDI